MEEKALTAKKSGFSMLPLCFIVFASGAALFVYAIGHLERGENALGGFLLVVAILGYIAGIIALPGFKVLKPQEALVLTLFGHYAGTLREPGFYWVPLLHRRQPGGRHQTEPERRRGRRRPCRLPERRHGQENFS